MQKEGAQMGGCRGAVDEGKIVFGCWAIWAGGLCLTVCMGVSSRAGTRKVLTLEVMVGAGWRGAVQN